jgi:hypothetical protein
VWPCVAVLFGAVHSWAKWPERPQLKQMWPEMVPTVGGVGRRITGRGGSRARVAACWCGRWGGRGAHCCYGRWYGRCCSGRGGYVEPWGYPVRYLGGALLDGTAAAFLFLVSLCARMASSAIMTLLTKSGNVPPMLSAMRSCSLVDRPIMKQSFFLASVST